MRTVLALSCVIAVGCGGAPAAPESTAPASSSVAPGPERPDERSPGLVVLAPDRGFAGNQNVRDALAASGVEPAAAVFVTDAPGTAGRLERAVDELTAAGARRIVVAPLFLSDDDPRLARLEGALSDVEVAPCFGDSYFAVEILADRLASVADRDGRTAVVVTDGAGDPGVRADLERIAGRAAAGLGYREVRVAFAEAEAEAETDAETEAEAEAETDADAETETETETEAEADAETETETEAEAETETEAEGRVIVPYELGAKLDSMMSLENRIAHTIPGEAELAGGGVTPHPTIALWMQRVHNRHARLEAGEIGVVLLAHGADFEWNETMRRAAAPLSETYLVEPAFSMADPPVIERAVRELEARGARAIVIVRIFGLASSFRARVERLVGWDVERPREHAAPTMPHHGGHARPARIRSGAVLATAGGLEDDPRFARALLDHAEALSRAPSRETVILVAHGVGDEDRNAHWLSVLRNLADHMRTHGADRYRAIEVATWREDWPEHRDAAIAHVRSLVEQATTDDGRALVIPARTTRRGHAAQFLDGLDFALGTGFAPHPLFVDWLESQVEQALDAASPPP